LHGGTIKGIEENLDYIKELGCNCIYLNPIFAANSYHKYDLIDYYHVDPTRGTDEDFRQMVRTAHEMGIRVMIDGVFNHVSWRHPFFKDVMDKGKESEYFDYFYEIPEKPSFPEKGEAPGYLCFAYVSEMPKTNTADKKLKEYFCDVGAYWIRDFDVDGWRLDVANEIDDQFLREFRNAVKAEKKDAIVIGEVWENANHYINGNMMDGAMNYDFRRFCEKFFAEKCIDAKVFDAGITGLLMRYPKQATYAQLNLLDSHDVSRFFTTCGEDRDKMELAVLFQMTFVGMPCIFYGDEKGLSGLEEAEYRRPMEFDREDPIEELYKSFIKIRNEHSSLRDGDFETLLSDGLTYAYRRMDEKESIIVYINNGDEPLAVNAQGKELMSKNFSNGTIGKNGYVILLAEQR
jgi:glycosidase